MRVRGPVGDGTYGDETGPIPRGHWEWVEDDPYADTQVWERNGYHGQLPRRRRRRWPRRLGALILAFGMLAVLLVGGMLLVTPSVGNAQALTRDFDQAHHAAYPGPPVPARFSGSLVATEDHRFYSEPGVDPIAVGRVLAGKVTGGTDQGGATLYQQLAKMLYTPGRSGVSVQAEQVGLGVKLAATYPQAQILQMYADVAYFGHGYYGLHSATCGYFGIQPSQLSWGQAALLAGLVQGPSADDPVLHYQIARDRESHVLGRLAAVGKLTQAQANAAYTQPLHLVSGGGHCA